LAGADFRQVWSAAGLSDAAIQACLTIKVLFGLPLPQTTGFGESVLELVGLTWTGLGRTSALCAAARKDYPPPFHIRDQRVRCTCRAAEGEGE